MDKGKNKYLILGIALLGTISIFVGASFAFWSFQINSTKKHIIKAADMDVVLEEDDSGITLENASPIYDEVGMIQKPYTFRLVNRGGIRATYILRLKDITESDSRLATSDVKYGLTRNGINKIKLLSTLPSDGRIDCNILKGGETVEYALRLWIRDGVTDMSMTEGKSLKYKLEVELTDEKTLSLARMKQGDYVAYTGNNGCSGSACSGTNATCAGGNNHGWRIAYIENNQAYLISAGSPECLKGSSSNTGTALDNVAKKYCNSKFVNGSCSDNSNAWSINEAQFQKIMRQAIGSTAQLKSCGGSSVSAACGRGNTLINNGGEYWFKNTYVYSPNYYYYCKSDGSISYYSGSQSIDKGVRPMIRLSSSVYITGGLGTASDPYTIDVETYD